MDAQVVYESDERFDMQSGPYGYSRVGFRIGDRVWWVGMSCSHMPNTWAADEALCKTLVERWNAGESSR